MSDFDDQFADVAMPLLAERMGDALTLYVGGDPLVTVALVGIVERSSDPSPHQTTVSKGGRQANESVQIQICTPGVSPAVDDSILLPDGSVAQVIRTIHADPNGNYPLVVCNLPHGITSKESRARS